MTAKEFLSDEMIKLPKTRPVDREFNNYIHSLLDDYYKRLKSITFSSGTNSSEFLLRVRTLIKGLEATITAYYRGSPFDAYRMLRDAIKGSKIGDYWTDENLLQGKNLYRLRIKNSNYPLPKEELFHIPFQLRGRVATQRFSIPGFPSLYLSNAVYVAWEEMRRPGLEDIQAARFVTCQKLNLINLTTSRYYNKYDRDEQQALSDIIMWPLIFLCSIKVKEPTNFFKPEYIVPQLLLQWIRNNRVVNGIKFSSTHIDLNETKSDGDFYNIVIPVVDNKEYGYCNSISKMFNMTDVLSWQLHQFSSGAPGVTGSYTFSDGINSEIRRIELVRNKTLPYEFSPLASLEYHLNEMKVHLINFV
jgi:hypothetical protein